MQIVIRHPRTIGEHADAVKNRSIPTHFQDKLVRDAVAEVLKAEGHQVKKTSSRGSVLHPEYVQDFIGEFETGFGSTDYTTHWKTLYNVQVVVKETESDFFESRKYASMDH